MTKLTAKTRRGLMKLLQLVEVDIDSMFDDDLTKKERAEMDQALHWLRAKALPRPRAADGDTA